MTILSDQGTTVPPVVYVPAHRYGEGDTETTLELRKLTDGTLVLLAYSSLDRLVESCGEFQPWVLVTAPQLEQLRPLTGFETVVLDAELPEELRHGPEALGTPEGGAR